MAVLEKISVLNPLSLRNTVGGELADMMEARGIGNYEELLGVKGLRAKERLSGTVMKKAAKLLGSPDLVSRLAVFQKEYLDEKPRYMRAYTEAKKNYAKMRGIVPLLRGEYESGYDRLDDILDFFGADTEEEVLEASNRHAALFRTQNNVEVNPVNLHAWLRRGELDFRAMNLPDYDEAGLKGWIDAREWAAHIEDVEYFKSLPDRLKPFGTGLVFVPFLPKTVYGAVRWFDGKPLIQVSDRGRDLASCWFTLFHEFGHAIKHRYAEIYEGSINETQAAHDKREREANKFANGYLLNGDDLRKAVFDRKRSGRSMSAASLAGEFGVHPLFASYWLLKAQYLPAFQRKIQIDFTLQYQ